MPLKETSYSESVSTRPLSVEKKLSIAKEALCSNLNALQNLIILSKLGGARISSIATLKHMVMRNKQILEIIEE